MARRAGGCLTGSSGEAVFRGASETLHRWTAAHSGQFMLFEFPKAPSIVHLEHLSSAAFLSGQATIEAHCRALDTLRAAAMSPEESVEFVAARADSFEENES